jgi:hypothetical protein
MPRRFDDDDEPRTRQSNSPLIVILALVAAFLMLVVVGGGTAAYVMVSRARHAEAVARAEAAESAARAQGRQVVNPMGEQLERVQPAPARILTKKEFEAAVVGHTKDEIIAAIGGPDDTREKILATRVPGAGPGRVSGVSFSYTWCVFRNRVLNDDTGKLYASVAVRIGPEGKGDLTEYP